ncbi:hypothetical protein SAMN05192588_0953 [Nonlabens sp. Hel1_33_55]|uniref:hypothetical protein n=1 Tax=Nonlabens sp. Hel1_33_55 TaxID=1336802 RepID=UPI000875CA97|nr:hypothetical protein [Nonlabens sp. Hel1_33_55]SCY06328.1 hypothetical protein SAMN05192588_0953 [Nonlabens sp. Hel1_33_55]
MLKSRLTIIGLILFTTLSCKNIEVETVAEEEFTEEIQTNDARLDEIQQKLQGDWKRVDYPYSSYEFDGNTAKLISEGQVEEPTFDPYELSMNCRFADNFDAELSAQEAVMINPKFESCEIISVENDTLRLSDLERSFEIVYTRN